MKTVTFSEFAELVEVTRQAVSYAAKDGGVLSPAVVMVKGKRHLDFNAASLAWQTRNKNKIRNGNPISDADAIAKGLPPIEVSRQKELYFKAMKLELETRQKNGELVEVDLVKRHIAGAAQALSQALDGFGRRHAHKAAAIQEPKEMALYLADAAQEIREAYLEHLAKCV